MANKGNPLCSDIDQVLNISNTKNVINQTLTYQVSYWVEISVQLLVIIRFLSSIEHS